MPELTPLERYVLEARGHIPRSAWSWAEIGRLMGISSEYVRILGERGMERLKDHVWLREAWEVIEESA